MHSSRPAAHRRRVPAALAGGLLLAALAGLLLSRRSRAPAPRPDLVLVVWDTCRADRLSLHGHPLPTTPRLAELAAGGVDFRRCFTPSPWTPPAHASLFTGLLPSAHGLRERTGDRVRQAIPLLASTLRAAGYETIASPANPLLNVTGLLEGFETVLPPTPGRDKDRADLVVERLDAWLRRRRDRRAVRRPLFLFVNLMDCHLPLDPPPEDLVAVLGREGAALVPPGGPRITAVDALLHMVGVRMLPGERLRVLPMAYDGGVHAADRATGAILDLLRREGLREEALVAVAGDHGESLGEHGELEHRHSVHDTVLHVPLVVRWPGRLEGGRVEEAQVRLQDLYATFLEAAGTAPPPACGADSVSLGASPLVPRDAAAEVESTYDQTRALFPGAPEEAMDRFRLRRLVLREAATGPSPRKLVVIGRDLPGGEVRPEKEELFDLRSDPGEDRDLLGPGGSTEDRAAADLLKARFAPLLR